MILKKQIYSQVHSIINKLGNEYISKLPKDVYSTILENKDNEYNPKINLSKSLKTQNISQEAISMIAYLHIQYWTNSKEDKSKIKEILDLNQKDISTSINNIFENNKEITLIPENNDINILDKLLDKLLDKYFKF